MLKNEPVAANRDSADDRAAKTAGLDTPWMICPNRDCLHLRRYGAPAMLPDGTGTCAACGAALARSFPPGTDVREPARLVTVAQFGEPYAAHLAKGRLEAEGILARVAGEHLATLNAMFADAGGLIRLEVPAQEVDSAIEVLRRDHFDPESTGDDAVDATTSMRVCQRCGSASIATVAPIGPRGILARIIGAFDPWRNRRLRCLTCGQFWRGAE